jgi:antitoxin ParD1/3/4
MATMNVSLPQKMKDWVEKRTADGAYANSSDYIRDLIREDAERQQVYNEIMEAAEEGLASGFSERSPQEILDATLAEIDAEAGKAKRRAR